MSVINFAVLGYGALLDFLIPLNIEKNVVKIFDLAWKLIDRV